MTKARSDNPESSAKDRKQLLQLDEDPRFHRQERVMRRVGTAGLCAFLLAALVGLFGSGPLSRAERHSSDGRLSATYERFARNGAARNLSFKVRARPTRGSELVRLTLNSSFAAAIEIDRIVPAPWRVATAPNAYVFEFLTTGLAASDIIFGYRPESLGWLYVSATAGGSQLQFRQFVYP